MGCPRPNGGEACDHRLVGHEMAPVEPIRIGGEPAQARDASRFLRRGRLVLGRIDAIADLRPQRGRIHHIVTTGRIGRQPENRFGRGQKLGVRLTLGIVAIIGLGRGCT